MCQLGWALECPDIWPNVVLGVSVGLFLDELSTRIGGLSKADGPPQCRGDSSRPRKA